MTDEQMIDNAATASQIDFDEATREAIKLNIIAPLQEEFEKLRNNLKLRDEYIVSKGLWSDFCSQLPK